MIYSGGDFAPESVTDNVMTARPMDTRRLYQFSCRRRYRASHRGHSGKPHHIDGKVKPGIVYHPTTKAASRQIDMMHREFMRALSTEERRTMTKKNNHSGLLRLALLVVLIIACSSPIILRTGFWKVLLIPQGLLLISLFHLLHECIHDTPFRSSTLNGIIGTGCGFILFIPCEWFRYFHRDHHRYTQIAGKDPELDSDKPQTKLQWLLHVSGLPIYKSLATTLYKLAFKSEVDSYIPDSARRPVIRQAQFTVAAYSLLFAASLVTADSTLFYLWLLPLMLGQPFLRLYLLAEHTLCEHTDNMFENTRTVLTNPVVRWFTWNMPYHTEHHVFPAVPFHRLPLLHKKMHQYLTNREISYSDFNRKLYSRMK